jgi:DNA-binding transcriptional ArsR family regulator
MPKISKQDQRLDAVFHSLSDRTRRALLVRLSKGPATVTELAVPFSMSLPAVSKHIRVLEQAKLIRREVTGRTHRCSIDGAPLRDVADWLDDRRAFWEGALDSLAEHVEKR